MQDFEPGNFESDAPRKLRGTALALNASMPIITLDHGQPLETRLWTSTSAAAAIQDVPASLSKDIDVSVHSWSPSEEWQTSWAKEIGGRLTVQQGLTSSKDQNGHSLQLSIILGKLFNFRSSKNYSWAGLRLGQSQYLLSSLRTMVIIDIIGKCLTDMTKNVFFVFSLNTFRFFFTVKTMPIFSTKYRIGFRNFQKLLRKLKKVRGTFLRVQNRRPSYLNLPCPLFGTVFNFTCQHCLNSDPALAP